MVKLTVLYGQPKDPAAFEKYYAGTHMPLAGTMDVRKVELSKVIATPDGSTPPFYRIADIFFDDMAHLQRSTSSLEGQATVGDLKNFATGGVTVLISEVA